MQLTALVESLEHVCCRYRLLAFRPMLEGAGHALDIQPLPKSWLRRINLFRELKGFNVLLQRRLLPPWQLALLRRSAARLVFDFDDAVFLRDSYSASGL
ncbi:MAG: glycosyltransferase family 4 protein, partial [Candidatus Acidiferrum sp.]